MNDKWDRRFLKLAQHVASWSKDPSTQTGAVIASGRRVLSLGYNGFPPGIADNERLHDRAQKYPIIVHCERNAVVNALASVDGGTLYTWPFGSCLPCASLMITAGIRRVVFPATPDELRARWGDELGQAAALYREAGVEVVAL